MIPKFRAWDKKDKLMGNVSMLKFSDVQHTQVIFRIVDEHGKKRDVWSALDDDGFGTCVLMQSTGLKDKNGVEIYEGDIVKWGDTPGGEEKPIRIATVKFNPDIQFDSSVGIFNYGQFAYKNTEKFLTILGNIYENNDLLEVAE